MSKSIHYAMLVFHCSLLARLMDAPSIGPPPSQQALIQARELILPQLFEDVLASSLDCLHRRAIQVEQRHAQNIENQIQRLRQSGKEVVREGGSYHLDGLQDETDEIVSLQQMCG